MHRKRRRERLPLIISWKKGKRGKERTRGPWPSRDQHSGPYGYIGSAKNRRDSSSAATDPPRSSAKGEGLGPASSHIGGAHLPGPRSPGAAHRSGPSRPAKDYRSRPAARFSLSLSLTLSVRVLCILCAWMGGWVCVCACASVWPAVECRAVPVR
jgi:hypothetical protein